MEGRELPVGWVVAPIAELATKVGSSATPKGGQSAYQITGTPLIRSMNVVFFGFKEEGLAYINDDQAQLLSNAEVRQGDVLLNITGASIGRVTAAPDWSEGARVNQHVCIIRPSGCLLQSYLSAYLSSPAIQSLILDENYGVTRQALTKQQVLELEIPVPPLNEQHRIAAKLDVTLAAVDACRQRLDGVAAILKRFRQAVLAAATSGDLTREWREINQPSQVPPQQSNYAEETFSDNPFPELPSGWTICRGADAVEAGADIVYGIVQPGPKLNDGVPYIRGTDIVNGKILEDQLLRTSEAIAERYKRSELKGGDVLLGIIRATKVAIVPASLAGANITQGTARFRPSSRIRTRFFAIALQSPLVQEWLHNYYRGIDMPGLNLADVRKVPIPLPALEEQDEIITRYDSLKDVADQLEARLATARRIVDRLTPALLAKAFRGELVPQDLSDEPASVLLNRIRAARQAEAAAGKPSRRGRSKTAANPDKDSPPAAPAPPDLLAQLLQECGALTERALLAASELENGLFRRQLAMELESGNIRREMEWGQQVLILAGSQ